MGQDRLQVLGFKLENGWYFTGHMWAQGFPGKFAVRERQTDKGRERKANSLPTECGARRRAPSHNPEIMT